MKATGQTGAATTAIINSKAQAHLAVNIIRVINTAEVVDCRTKNGKMDPTEKFRPWNELLGAPCFRQALSHFSGGPFAPLSETSFSPEPEIVPRLELRLVVSPDGSHDNLWLGRRKYNCGTTFFSDERGIIFEGKAIGPNASLEALSIKEAVPAMRLLHESLEEAFNIQQAVLEALTHLQLFDGDCQVWLHRLSSIARRAKTTGPCGTECPAGFPRSIGRTRKILSG